MLELERRNVRVVSGRSGKEVNDVEHDTMGAMGGVGAGAGASAGGMIGGGGDHLVGQLGHPNDSSALSSLFQHTPDLTNSTGVDMNQMNVLNFGNNGIGGGDFGESNLYGSTNPQSQPADAYTVAREDYYRKLADKKKDQDGCVSTVVSDGSNSMEKIPTTINNDKSSSSSYFKSQSHRQSLGSVSSMNSLKGPGRGSLGLGSLGGGVTGGGMMPNNLNISVNANQHYEMLKLHHMNLLNEIHETTLMMNMHQQHQLQLQQQQHQQEMIQQQKQQQLMDEASTVAEDFNGKLSTLASVSGQQDNFSGMHKPSSSSSSASFPTPGLKAETTDTYESYELTGTSQNKSLDTSTTNVQNYVGGSGQMIKTSSSPSSISKSSRAEQLRKIQEEIAERQRMLEELENAKTDERTEGNAVNGNYHHDDSTGRVESDRAVKRIKTLQWETNE